MDALIVIPARLDSQRLPHKLLRYLDDLTVLEHTCARVSQCSAWADWTVATDSAEIYDLITAVGYPVMMTSDHHQCGTERCAEAMISYDADIIINVQGDEPFVSAYDLRVLYDTLLEGSCDICTLYTDAADRDLNSPDVVKISVSDGIAVDFMREPDGSELYHHIGVYAFRRKVLEEVVKLPLSTLEVERRLEQMRWMEAGYDIAAVYTEHIYHSIDTMDDLIQAKSMLS